MTNAQLEQVVLVQSRELTAQRQRIMALETQVTSLSMRCVNLERHVAELQACAKDAKQYRRGYQAGWAAGRRDQAIGEVQRVTKAAVNG